VDAQTDKAVRRKRKAPPRRVPAVIEQRERKPLFFGWGADLNHRERESVKERIALLAGIAIAAALVLLLGWGWYQDNVATPAAARAQANKPIAQIGSYIIRTGFFQRFEQFENTQFSNQVQQLQQQISADQGKKNSAALVAQYQAQVSQLQQQLGSLPSSSLTTLLDDQTVLQRSYTLGFPNTPAVQKKAMDQLAQQAGGRKHLQTFIDTSGLTNDEFTWLTTADFLKGKIGPKLESQVGKTQIKVRASHILVASNNKSLADKLYREILHGANFAALAKKYSTDPGSAKKGGDLGYFIKGQMVPQFSNAAFSMKVGQVRLVKSQYGWHIIKVTGRKRAPLSSTEYQQAQQAAYSGWITQQQGILHVQRFVAPTSLPNVATPTTSTTNPSVNTLPQGSSQQPAQVPQNVHIVPKNPAKPSKAAPKLAPAKSGKGSTSTQKKP